MPLALWKALYQVNTTDDAGANAFATNEQSGSEIVALTGDRVFVAWNDSSTNFSGLEPPDSVGQILDPLGGLNGGETYLSGVFGDGAQTNVDIAALPNGGFVAAYQTQDFNIGTHGENIGFQVFDADGNIVFSRASGTLNDPGSTSGVHQLDNERDPAVVAFADGSFMVVYEDDSAGNSDIWGVVIDATGAEQPSFAIDAAAAEATRPDAVTLSNGDMAVVYQSAGAAGDILFSVRTSTGGAVASGTVAGGASGETLPAVAALRGVSGGFAVVWADATGDGAGNAGIKLRLYSNAGAAAGAAVSANVTTKAGAQTQPTVTGLLDGSLLVAWADAASGDILAQRFSAAGAAVDAEFVMASLDTLSQPKLTTLDDGRVALSVTNTDGTGDLDIYAALWDPRTSPAIGTAGNDVLTSLVAGGTVQGLQGDDRLYSGAGNDRLEGGGDTDTADYSAASSAAAVDLRHFTQNSTGGLGIDVLVSIENLMGGGFNDLLKGNIGANVISGGGGGDRILGDDGGDTLNGDAGADYVTGGLGDDTINGGNDSDTWLGGDAGIDTVSGGQGDDRIDGGNDVDTLNGDAGADYITGGAGGDTIDGGGDSDPWLAGDAGIDTVNGGLGNDRLDGGADADTLRGDAGNDYISGGLGDDVIEGGVGTDSQFGGAGLDVFDFNPGGNSDNIYDFTNDEDTLRIDPGYGFANAAAVAAATVAFGSHARIQLPDGFSIYLVGYLVANSINSLLDDILIG